MTTRHQLWARYALLAATVALTGCHHGSKVAKTQSSPAYGAPELADERTPASVERRPPTRGNASPSVQGQVPDGRPTSSEVGLASWYGPPYHNHKAADGSIFDQNALTVAHRTLPLGTIVKVTNDVTGESVVARVTDRGPFVQGRVLDLSLAAAKAISVYRAGVAKVRVEAWVQQEADPEGRWCVQIGVFLDPNDAVQLKNDLARRYQAAKVIEFAGPTGHWVRINPVQSDKLTASRIADSIHIPDADPYLVRLN